jgi:hypothetical protein
MPGLSRIFLQSIPLAWPSRIKSTPYRIAPIGHGAANALSNGVFQIKATSAAPA